MEIGQRNTLEQKISSVQQFSRNIKKIEADMKKYLGEHVAEEIQEQFRKLEKIMIEEKEKLPAGHIYHGTYYLRKQPYMIKPGDDIFEKKEGPIFMNEKLVSWHSGKGGWYLRYAYKDPELKQLLQRKDGKPINSIPDEFR